MNTDGHVGGALPPLSRTRMWRRAIALAFVIALGAPAFAVEPSEMLKDPVLESRARTISEGLRCLVCQNESVDDSHAELAHDIRVLVRERLQAGDSNEQVRDYLVARYGQFILLRPPFELQTLLLWGTPALVLLLGAGGIVIGLRRRAAQGSAQDLGRPLNETEQKRLEDILHPRGRPTA